MAADGARRLASSGAGKALGHAKVSALLSEGGCLLEAARTFRSGFVDEEVPAGVGGGVDGGDGGDGRKTARRWAAEVTCEGVVEKVSEAGWASFATNVLAGDLRSIDVGSGEAKSRVFTGGDEVDERVRDAWMADPAQFWVAVASTDGWPVTMTLRGGAIRFILRKTGDTLHVRYENAFVEPGSDGGMDEALRSLIRKAYTVEILADYFEPLHMERLVGRAGPFTAVDDDSDETPAA